MSELTDLPNIGKALAEKLERIGISNLEQLAAIGSVEAVTRIGRASRSECYNMLYALEGAIRGVRWHSLSAQARRELKDELDAVRTNK